MATKSYSQEKLSAWLNELTVKLLDRCDVEVCFYKNGSTRLTISNVESTDSWVIPNWADESHVTVMKCDILKRTGVTE